MLELSLREALQLGHTYIGTEHILLGLLREGDGVAAQILTGFGVGLDGARQRVIELLTGRHPAGPAPAVADDLRERLTSLAARLAVIEHMLRDAGNPG